MEIFDNSKSILENLYFLSGPALAVLGLFIFRQIKLAKTQLTIAKQQLEESQEELKINSQRQAANLAADKVKEYVNEIIILENKIFDEKLKINFPSYKGEIKEFTNDEIKDWDKDFLDAFLKKPDNIALLELEIVNRLEAFSVYFIKGIADEKIAFNSIGRAFCDSVRRFYPIITLLRGRKNPNKPYEILIQLYRCWEQRLETYKIEAEKDELSKEVKAKLEKLEQLSEKKTDLDIIKIIGA